MIEDVANFDVLTSTLEKNERSALCNTCNENKNVGESSLCMKCACPIEYVITYKFKLCPLNKWNV